MFFFAYHQHVLGLDTNLTPATTRVSTQHIIQQLQDAEKSVSIFLFFCVWG